MFGFGLVVGLVGGGAAVWFGKDTVTKWVMGAEAFASKLQTQANSILSTIKKL